MKFNKFFGATIASIVFANVVFPALVLADDPVPTSGTIKTAENFCARINETTTAISQNISDREGKLITKMNERTQKLSQQRADKDNKLVENRAEWDAKREPRFVKLAERAVTDAEKAAFSEFKTAIQNAINARRVAFDAARQTFQDGIDNIITSRKTAVDEARATFKAGEQAAVDKANADCASGAKAKTARAVFQANLKKARVALQADIKAIEKGKNGVKALVEARQAAFKVAHDAFRATIQKAMADLKKVFGETPKEEAKEEATDTQAE